MAPFKNYLLKGCGRQDRAVEVDSAPAIDEHIDGAVLRAAISVMSLRQGVHALGDVDAGVTLTLHLQRPMTFPYSDVETGARVGVLKASIHDAVVGIFSTECAKMLRDIVPRTHLDVFRRSSSGDQPAGVEHMIVWLQHSATVARSKPPSDGIKCGGLAATAGRC